MMSLSLPVPSSPRTRTGMMVTPGITDAGDPGAVVDTGGGDGRHIGAVAVGIGGGVGSVEGPSADHSTRQVGSAGVDAGVEDRNGRAARRRDDTKDVFPADQRKGPLIGVAGIVGNGLGRAGQVEVDTYHRGIVRRTPQSFRRPSRERPQPCGVEARLRTRSRRRHGKG